MTLASVFLLSLSSLVFEVVLTRFFSLSQGSALAFLSVGVAMLGSAAGGSAYSIRAARGNRRAPTSPRSVFPILVPVASLAGSGALVAARLVPLDYLRLPLDPVQFVWLLLLFLLLSLPFFLCGLATSAAYAGGAGRIGRIAFSSLAGSAAGAVLPFGLFPLLGEGGTLAASCALPAFLALIAAVADLRRRLSVGTVAMAALALAAVSWQVLLLADGRLTGIPLSPYAALSQLRRIPGTRVSETLTDLRGRVDLVECPSFRPASGLSLYFTGSLPPQDAVIQDGDRVIVPCGPADGERIRAAPYTLPFCGWALAGKSPRSLLVLQSGGTGLACALAAGDGRTTVVVDHPRIASLLRARWEIRDPSGGTGGPAEFIADGPRAFLAGTADRFRLIQVEDWGASMPGLESLSAGFLYTADAFREYFRHLESDGILVAPRRLLVPPSDIVRLFATARSALAAEGVERPLEHIAVARSWDASLLLVSRSPLRGGRLGHLRDFASAMGFDLDWFPGVTAGDVNRYNRFAEPYHYEALRSAAEDPGFFHDYLLDVSVQTDDRPFPSRFLKWTRIGDFYRTTGSRPHVLLLSGEAAVAVMLAAAVVVSLAVLLLPAVSMGRARRAADGSAGSGAGAAGLAAFAACGAGFVFAEMHMLDAMALAWNNPSKCFAVVLGCVLAASAAGGMLTGRIADRGFPVVLSALPIAMAVVLFALPAGVRFALGLPAPWRPAAAFLLLAPPSVLLGMPFPLTMRLLVHSPRGRALAWAVNGCASVLASVLSMGIAMALGVRALAGFSVACYAAMLILAAAARHRRAFH